jgi:arylsulfatase A-like enzyme
MSSALNVLWVVTTQWRAQACGYAGDPNAQTPALDALSREAVNYEQAVTPHPFGPFARAAMLTGVTSPANGVRDYFDPLPKSARTVAHRFLERDFETGFFGKWHLAQRDSSAPLVGETHARMVVPADERGGFSFWEGFEGGFQLNNPWLHGSRFPSPRQTPGYQSDVLCERAGDWLQGRSRPWFCVVSLEPPHPPYDAAPPDFKLPASSVRLAPNVPEDPAIAERARNELAGYYGQIAATDSALGRLLNRIERTNTVVVVTSVHGDMHGAHGLFRKGWPHEESVRVPLLVRMPGQSPKRTSERITLADLAQLSVTAAIERKLPRVSRQAAAISMPSVVPLPHQCDRIWRGFRSAERKVVFTEAGDPWMAFDLTVDPLEKHNLITTTRREECCAWYSEMEASSRIQDVATE